MFTPASHQVPALSEPGLRMSTVSNYSGQAKRLQTMVSSLFGPGRVLFDRFLPNLQDRNSVIKVFELYLDLEKRS